MFFHRQELQFTPPPTHPDERFYGTTPKPNLVEKAAGVIKDAVTSK